MRKSVYKGTATAPIFSIKPVALQNPVDPIAHGASRVSLGAARGETMIPNDCMMSAILKPNMILLYGEHRPLSEQMIIMAMVDEAVNDMEAIHVLII